MRWLAAAALAAAAAVVAPSSSIAAPAPSETRTSHQPCGHWGSYGRVPARTFDYDCPSAISPTTASALVPRWVFKTAKTVTASPAVVDGRVFVGDWSATMHALDADTGAELWRFHADDAAGAPFGPIVASAAVAEAGDRTLVVFGSGPTMHALDAATGQEVWSTYVGSAADRRDHPVDEQTEFESSPVIVGGVVYSGLDVHNRTVEENHGVRGGVLAFDLATGEVLGRFDVEHDHRDDRTGQRLSGCSSVWSSPTVDVDTGTLFFATGNCPHDLPAGSDWGRHVEAVSAIDADPSTWDDPAAAVRWTFTPEPLNRDDTDFGATPNLFVDATGRRLLGIGKKDAAYYALDPATGELVWSTRVTEPGNVGEDFAVGGFIGSTATGRGGVYGGTALGFAPPYFHALDGATGAVRWSSPLSPTYAASAHVNGVVLAGALDDLLKVWDARTGALLGAHPLLGPISSGPAIVGDRVYVGSGTASSDLCAKDTPGADLCLAVFDQVVGATGGVHAFELAPLGHRAATVVEGGTGALLAAEGGRLWAHDLATLERRVAWRGGDEGQVCADPAGAGGHVVGGSYVRLRGTEVEEVRRLDGAGDGCAFLGDGRLVTAGGGSLRLWASAASGDGCVVASGVDATGGLAADGSSVLVPTPAGVVRHAISDCAAPADGRPFIAAVAPTAVAPSGRGTWYVASATGIAEHAGDGSLLRALPPAPGRPTAVAVADDGTLYYADAGVVPGDAAVRRIRFASDSQPSAPETLIAGLDGAGGLGLAGGDPTIGGAPPAAVPTGNRRTGAAVVGRLAAGGGSTDAVAVALLVVALAGLSLGSRRRT